MAKEINFVDGAPVIKMICEALDIEPDLVNRLVLDAEYGSVPKLYIETRVDDRILQINWAAIASNLNVIQRGEKSTLKNLRWEEDERGPYWIADKYEQGIKVGNTGSYYNLEEDGSRLPQDEQEAEIENDYRVE